MVWPHTDDPIGTATTSRRRFLTGIGGAVAGGVLAETGVATAATTSYFGPNRHLESTNPSAHQDVEPQIVSDASGTLYVGSIRGVPAGTDVWRSDDSGRNWTYLGQPTVVDGTSDVGGGDVAMAVGDPYGSSPGNVYVSTLWLGSLYFATSADGGRSWTTVNPVSSLPFTPVDRQWLATDGTGTVYQSFHDVETSNIDVIVSTDGGLTWLPRTPATEPKPLVAAAGNELGNLVFDGDAGRLYQIWAAPSSATGSTKDTVYMSASADGGSSWTVSPVYTDAGTSLDHIFPIVTVDRAGTVYAVWSDDTDVFYAASGDFGTTWTDACRVNTGDDTNTAIFPWASGGADGVLDVTFYGTTASSNQSTDAKWRVYWTQVTDALGSPTRAQVEASDHVIHTGAVCEGGTGCSGNRQLADVFDMTLDPDGDAHVAFTDDHDSSLPPQTYVANQVAGPSAY